MLRVLFIKQVYTHPDDSSMFPLSIHEILGNITHFLFSTDSVIWTGETIVIASLFSVTLMTSIAFFLAVGIFLRRRTMVQVV